MADLDIVRFQAQGPPDQGLELLHDITAGMLVEGSPIPVETGHEYFATPHGDLTAGVWHCTPFESKIGPYPVSEFMLVLEGAVSIVCGDGREETFRSGDAFVLPRGLSCGWRQTEELRKYYVIYDDPAGRLPERSESLRPIRLERDGPAGRGLQPLELAETSVFLGQVPSQHEYTYFTDPSGQMTAGVWTCTPMHRAGFPFPRIELMCLLEGSVTLSDAAGQAHKFRAPDVFLVPEGVFNSWHSSEDVRKFYCIFQRAQR